MIPFSIVFPQGMWIFDPPLRKFVKKTTNMTLLPTLKMCLKTNFKIVKKILDLGLF